MGKICVKMQSPKFSMSHDQFSDLSEIFPLLAHEELQAEMVRILTTRCTFLSFPHLQKYCSHRKVEVNLIMDVNIIAS